MITLNYNYVYATEEILRQHLQSARHAAGQRVFTIYDLRSTSRLQGPQVIYSKRCDW